VNLFPHPGSLASLSLLMALIRIMLAS